MVGQLSKNYVTVSLIFSKRCFLNPENKFIWAFILPVVVIIVMTFVLFIIVVRVMWKHQKKMTDKSTPKKVWYVPKKL